MSQDQLNFEALHDAATTPVKTNDSKPVIAFDVAQTCTTREGCAWHADALARAIAANSGRFSICLYHQFSPWINPDCSNGTEIEGIAAPFQKFTLTETFNCWKNTADTGAHLPDTPSILHSNSYSVPPKPKGTKLIYTIHDLCFWTHPSYTSEQNRLVCQTNLLHALQEADAFIFISKCAHNDFETIFPNWLKNNNRLWKIIHSGSRFNIEDQHDEKKNTFKEISSPWLYVGSIEPRKNIPSLLETYATYYKTSSHKRPLIIAGSPKSNSKSDLEAIKAASNDLPIHQLGYVNEAKLLELYQSSFALLHPSHYEGFGLPVIEAMSQGLPVIAKNIPSVAEFASESSLLHSFEIPSEVGTSMIQLETEFSKYKTLQKAGYQTAKAFTWENAASKTIEFYDEVLSEPS